MSSCSNCVKLLKEATEKDEEIKQLTIEVQNLRNCLKFYEDRTCKKCNCFKKIKIGFNEKCSTNVKSKHESPVEILSPDAENNSCDVIEISSNFKTSDVRDNGQLHDSKKENKPCSSEEYIYDENYKMYYCVSTGYYYDKNSGLYYIPQNGAYYTYDYSKNAYVLCSEQKTDKSSEKVESQISNSEVDKNINSDEKLEEGSHRADDSCESVADQVNNLHINDIDCRANNNISPLTLKHSATEVYDSSDVEKTDNLKIQKNESESNLNNIWDTPVGSDQTIQDVVREVAEQSSGMSDYTYDEKSQMYYSASTGYYYDAVKKLLYDPQSGTYYKYDEDTSSYEFHSQVDLIATSTVAMTKTTNPKVKARQKYWRKKLNVTEEKIRYSPDFSAKDDHKEGYSSPEEGELFSSDSDQESECQPEVPTRLENSSKSYSPCIRAIVKESEKYKIGTLFLITCIGGKIGRDKTNIVSISEIGVSKIHAEVVFNNELWKYEIKDLGSQNGTFVNDYRLSEPKQPSSPCVLNHGDIVSIGSCKLMFHIHAGHETCDNCEPGQVMAEKPAKDEKLNTVIKTKEEKEKERREEVRRLKKKYGLESINYVDDKNSVLSSGYEDKADIRRKTVGSENPYEKTEVSSLESSVNESNKGYQMLKKLGWKEGDCLGVTGIGISEPVPLRPWLSKAGLGSSAELQKLMLALPEDKRNKKWVLAQERFLKLA